MRGENKGMCVQFSFILESRLTTTALLILRYRWEMNGKLAGWTAMAGRAAKGGLAKLFARERRARCVFY